MSQHSNDATAKTVVPQGSSDQWDAIWKEYSAGNSSMRKVFTRAPRRPFISFGKGVISRTFCKSYNPRVTGNFLELASGRGTTSMYLASYGMTDITLLDLSATALKQAESNFVAEDFPRPKIAEANAEDTGLSANQFDCIYNVGVLEHFEDPTKILAETCRLLKPGGRMFMPIVPARPFAASLLCRTLFNPISIAKRLVKFLLRRQSKKNTEMVRTETGRREYQRIAEQIGFCDVQCIPYNAYWKVNRDGSFVERNFALPAYKLHHAIKHSLKTRPSLKTLDATASCLLLVGNKPIAIDSACRVGFRSPS